MQRAILTWSTGGNTQNLVDYITPGGAGNTLEGWAAIQRNHSSLEKLADGKHKILYLGRNNPWQDRLGIGGIESISTEEDLRGWSPGHAERC